MLRARTRTPRQPVTEQPEEDVEGKLPDPRQEIAVKGEHQPEKEARRSMARRPEPHLRTASGRSRLPRVQPFGGKMQMVVEAVVPQRQVADSNRRRRRRRWGPRERARGRESH